MATDLYGYVYPLTDAQVEFAADALALANSVGPSTIQSCASAGARSALFPSPYEGQMVWLRDIHRMTEYNGVQWREKDDDGAALPASVSAYGNGQNVITALSATDLPSFTANATMINPHLTKGLLVKVVYSCWIVPNGVTVRAYMRCAGNLTIGTTMGSGGAVMWGQVPMSGDTGSNAAQKRGNFTCIIPANGSAQFNWTAFKDSSAGAANVNYPCTNVIPLRYA